MKKAIHLTSKERQIYLALLSPEQRKTLNEYRKYKYNSEVLTEFSQSGGDWKFLEMQINYNYDPSHPQDSTLKCSCGKGVKYLYYCQSNITGEVLGFGSEHLKQEAGISNAVVREILNGQHKIDRGLDEILYWYARGYTFPKLMYEFIQEFAFDYEVEEYFKTKDLKFLAAFEEQNLPIYNRDYKKLEKLVQDVNSRKSREEYERKLEEEEKLRKEREEKERQEREKRKREEEKRRVEEERKAKLGQAKKEAKIKKLKAKFKYYLDEQASWEEKHQANLEEKANQIDSSKRKQTLRKDFSGLANKRKEVTRRARLLFDKLFDEETSEMYALDPDDYGLILVLYGILGQGKTKAHESVNIANVAVGFVTRLAKKFEYPVRQTDQELYQLYDKLVGILLSKGVIRRQGNRVVYAVNIR
ncbi:hypothetical protein [Ligilactobacillus salivarius]|uniref:Uncharacterized protein n=1 Tax=Ligilactobacillus salivarius TaxID=1624 RepID=A0A9X6XIE8_9LACO|nr:hypothetical protein [Ligilactobacillus salivarius]OTF88961.1 hypothetical protein A8C38_09115 [Ligilactobacillus salivarius]PAY26013.1 hypothetical protein A8C33_09210 [Ligilactobacillus salivarius]PAY28314.1 hypothetical protein A8C49_08810 [Ligilactobacillus salivarius]PAY29255.1 hypothetical protein A8C44_02035 [Ligilactobacillus salivarius]PAY34308.1 hypothetical protein A8C50_01305 [Ligilactobacillus salivarius]